MMSANSITNTVFTGDHAHNTARRVRNWYACPDCRLMWHGDWHCACDDGCPRCEQVAEPSRTVVIDVEAERNPADAMRAYTVLLVMPDYAANNYGEDFETVQVTAANALHAFDMAKASVASAREIDSPDDLAPVAIFAGHQEPIMTPLR